MWPWDRPCTVWLPTLIRDWPPRLRSMQRVPRQLCYNATDLPSSRERAVVSSPENKASSRIQTPSFMHVIKLTWQLGSSDPSAVTLEPSFHLVNLKQRMLIFCFFWFCVYRLRRIRTIGIFNTEFLYILSSLLWLCFAFLDSMLCRVCPS